MNYLSEPSLTKNLQTTKTIFKDNLSTCKSSSIIGRKINNLCLTVKSAKSKKFTPNVLISQSKKRNESTRRLIHKKSPGRSLSLNRLLSDKETKLDIPVYVSPPRGVKKNKDKTNKSSQILEDLPRLDGCESACPSTSRVLRKNKIKTNKSSQILEDLSKCERPSPYNSSKIITKTLIKKKVNRLEKIEKNDRNEKIDSIFKDPEEKSRIKIEKPKGLNIPRKKTKKIAFSKISSENKTLRETKNSDFEEMKVKTDREAKKIRKKKGIDFFSIFKSKPKKLNKSAENLRHKKSPETPYESLKRLKKPKKIPDFLKDDIKTKVPPSPKPEKIKKLKLKKKKKTKSMWVEDQKSTPAIRRKNKGQLSEDKREMSLENKEILKEKMRTLKLRVRQTKKNLLSKEKSPPDYIDQVIKIQRWFRQVRPKLQSSLTSSDLSRNENLFITTRFVRSNSDLVKSFENQIFVSAESEAKQLKTKTSFNSMNENSGSDILSKKKEKNENCPKKVQKIPPLYLNSILQSKNLSVDFNFESSEQLLEDSGYEIESEEYRSESSAQVRQISSLDIERQSESSSQSSVLSRKSFENFTSDEEDNEKEDQLNNWISKFIERAEETKLLQFHNEENSGNDLKTDKFPEFSKDFKEKNENIGNLPENPNEKPENSSKNISILKPTAKTSPIQENLKELQIPQDSLEIQSKLPTDTISSSSETKPLEEIFQKPVSLSSSYQNLFNKIRDISGKSSKELIEMYPVESPRLISDYSKDDLSYEDSSELSHLTDPEVSLRRILQSNNSLQNELIERPENRMIRDSDSSDDDGNTLKLHTDTNISEEKLESFSIQSKPFLSEYDEKIDFLVQSEVENFTECIKFLLDHKEIDVSLQFIEKYLKSMEEKLKLNEEEILELINTPSYQDPNMKLEYLQSSACKVLMKFPTLELILPQDLSSDLKVEFEAMQIPSRQIYLQMIFDCVNEALNHVRPFALYGLPDPWSPVSSTLYGEGQIRTVFSKVLRLVKKWESVKCGLLVTHIDSPDEEKVTKSREERLNVLLAQNVRDSENAWMDYEDEEAQTKIEVTGLVFESLVQETFNLLQIFD